MDRRTLALVVTTVVAVIGTLDSALSLFERAQSGINFGELLGLARLVSGPLALVLVLYLWRGPTRGRTVGPRPPERFRPDWASKDRPGHWNGIRETANQLRADLQETLNRVGDGVTGYDLKNILARVESLEANVVDYEDTWGLGSSFWDQRARDRWERQHLDAPERPQHSWAVQLWERVGYVISWVYRHPPDARPPKSRDFDPWVGWSDMGS